jgi:hypothetical protein
MTVWVCGAIVVVVVGPPGIVVVVLTGQLPALQASQQLATRCTQPVPPFGAVQFLASGLIEQFATPCAFVRQQVTKPGRPQVDWAAQWTTARLHCFGRVPLAIADFTAPATHLTYSR